MEYEEAFKWYNERSELAADNLILAFQQTIEAICNDPFRFRNNYKTYRELSLKKYPYSIVYFIDEENQNILIISFFHHKRNPSKKYIKDNR